MGQIHALAVRLWYNSLMLAESPLDQLMSPAAGWLTPQAARQLVDWTIDEQFRTRIEHLGEKANRGELSAEEDAEYRAYLDDAEVISLLQAKARRLYPDS